MVIGDLKFQGIPCHSINLDDIKVFMADDGNARRINFATTHCGALRKDPTGNPFAWLNLPFKQTVEPLMKKELGISGLFLFLSKFSGKPYRRIDTEREYNDIKTVVDRFQNYVFLRDCLDLSIALSMNMEDNTRTPIGELEYRVKYHAQEIGYAQDISALTNILQLALDSLPYFKEVDYICVVPSSHNFMQDIVKGLSGFKFKNISDKISWNKTIEVKNANNLDEKLEALLASDLSFADDLDLMGKNVLLLDDLYKSGITMQYVAMKLKEAGCGRVFGMTLVKSLGNK